MNGLTVKPGWRAFCAAMCLLGVSGCASLGIKTRGGPSADFEARRPNVIIIFTDDQGYQDVGVFGSPLIATPHLDQMAAEGRKFTDFCVASSVCTPSRAALLTGCYPKRVGLTGVLFPRDRKGMNSEEFTIAEMFKSKGYATACVGKWHLGHHKEFLPPSHGFDCYFGIPYSNDMDRKDAPLPLVEGFQTIETRPDQSLLTRRYTEKALAGSES